MADNKSIPVQLDAKAQLPQAGSTGAAGFDCVAIKREFLKIENGEFKKIKPTEARQFDLVRYHTGVFMELPEGYVALAFARSSISKMPLIMANTTGVIDSDYRGEIMFMFRILNPENIAETSYQTGERVGQLVIMPFTSAEFAQVNNLTKSQRGSDGFGSTGR